MRFSWRKHATEAGAVPALPDSVVYDACPWTSHPLTAAASAATNAAVVATVSMPSMLLTGSSDTSQMRLIMRTRVRAPVAKRIKEAVASPGTYKDVPDGDYQELLKGVPCPSSEQSELLA